MNSVLKYVKLEYESVHYMYIVGVFLCVWYFPVGINIVVRTKYKSYSKGLPGKGYLLDFILGFPFSYTFFAKTDYVNSNYIPVGLLIIKCSIFLHHLSSHTKERQRYVKLIMFSLVYCPLVMSEFFFFNSVLCVLLTWVSAIHFSLDNRNILWACSSWFVHKWYTTCVRKANDEHENRSRSVPNSFRNNKICWHGNIPFICVQVK